MSTVEKSAIEATIHAVFVQKLGYTEDELVPDASLEQLGFDSLSKVELIANILQAHGVRLPESSLHEDVTFGEIPAIVAGAAGQAD